MTIKGTVLVTGVTGSIGSWMARTLLDNGLRVVVLTRAHTDEAAGARTLNALQIVGAQVPPGHLRVIRGDLCSEDLVEHLAVDLPDLSLIINCAGVLEFGEEFGELNHQVNVLGTSSLLHLAESLRIPFAHFSTAYIAGRRQGRVLESEIDVGQEFHNPYELSKCRAEARVRAWAVRTGLDAFVLRPSIVVGDSQDGRIVNFDGLYSILRVLDSVAGIVGTKDFRVLGDAHVTKNFVPADYVARAAWHIIARAAPGTYHLTNPRPMPLATLRDILAELFAIPGARFVDKEAFQSKPADRLERAYQKSASVYAPYLATEPIFDRTRADVALTDCHAGIPEMDLAFFRTLLAFARDTHWGKTAPAVDCSREHLVERYFTRFLREKMHQQLLPNLRNLSATCRITVEDLPRQSWSLHIDTGRLEHISTNGIDCQCTFSLASETFSAIVSGRLTPQRAFFEKKVDIQGDIETGLKLTTVLAAFFKKWPYEPERCHA